MTIKSNKEPGVAEIRVVDDYTGRLGSEPRKIREAVSIGALVNLACLDSAASIINLMGGYPR